MSGTYHHNKVAQFLFNLCYKGARFLNKYKFFYYFLIFTWGLPMTIIGLFASVILLSAGINPIKYNMMYYFKAGKYWGGISLGITFIRDTTSNGTIEPHEYGHTFQNAILGPFFIFLVAIPSFIRYYYQRYSKRPKKVYDAIWFEHSATFIGDEIKKGII